MKRLVKVFHSRRHQGMYLFVDAAEQFSQVPEALMERFGAHSDAMTLVLTPERKLARTDAAAVLRALDEQGFYLQLPPCEADEMAAIAARNSKLHLS